MVEDNFKNGTSGSGNNTVNNDPAPDVGNIEQPSNREDSSTSSQQGNSLNFLVFLILILLLMGDTSSFSNHFQLINDEVEKITKMLEAISVTNDNLQNAVKAPQEVMQNFKGFNN